MATIFNDHAPHVYQGVALRPFNLQGWGLHAALYTRLVDLVKAQFVMEVGVWKVASSVFLAKLLAAHDVVLSVETWLGSLEHWREGTSNPQQYGLHWEHGHPSLYGMFQSNVI